MELIDTTSHGTHFLKQSLLEKGDAILYLLCFIPGIGLHEELYNFIKSRDCCLSSCIWVENQRQERSVKDSFGQKIACDRGLKSVNFKGKHPNWFTVFLSYDDNMPFVPVQSMDVYLIPSIPYLAIAFL